LDQLTRLVGATGHPKGVVVEDATVPANQEPKSVLVPREHIPYDLCIRAFSRANHA
jgi:hypothetical protein